MVVVGRLLLLLLLALLPLIFTFTRSRLPNPQIFFIVGGPGSGKGTQCDRLKRTLGLTHISSGDLLREEVARETPRGKELLEIMKRGELVPMESVLDMIRDAMMKAVLKDAKGVALYFHGTID